MGDCCGFGLDSDCCRVGTSGFLALYCRLYRLGLLFYVSIVFALVIAANKLDVYVGTWS